MIKQIRHVENEITNEYKFTPQKCNKKNIYLYFQRMQAIFVQVKCCLLAGDRHVNILFSYLDPLLSCRLQLRLSLMCLHLSGGFWNTESYWPSLLKQ